MRISLLPVYICSFSAISFAQSPAFEADMQNIQVAHDTASSVSSEFIAIEQCRKVSGKYPDAWLPRFWAAYFATQLTQYPSKLEDIERKAAFSSYLEEAQKHLDVAIELIPGESTRSRSSAQALQSLIYSFMSAVSELEKADKFRALYKKTLTKAIKTSPDNPVVLVLTATDMIKAGTTEKDIRKILAGKTLLDRAKETFDLLEKNQIHTSLTANFNREWVEYWSGYANKLLGI